MFLDDLSAKVEEGPRAVAVGWLDLHHSFTRGPTTLEFQRKLCELCMNPVRRTRGFHSCAFCNKDDVRGNGEVHVPGFHGQVFVAPSLISHYVNVHDYRPPDQFIEAVVGLVREPISIGRLSESILRVADEPSHENRSAFYEAFVKSRVGVRVPVELASVSPGRYVTTSENRVSVPRATSPDGKPMLLVLADVDRLAKLEAATTFMELDAKDIINMAVCNHTGIIVQTWLPAREAWAGIPEQDVLRLSRS